MFIMLAVLTIRIFLGYFCYCMVSDTTYPKGVKITAWVFGLIFALWGLLLTFVMKLVADKWFIDKENIDDTEKEIDS